MKKLLLMYPVIFVSFMFISCEKEVSTSPEDDIIAGNSLFVDSNPQGSKIYLDFRYTGQRTPDTVTWVETGTHFLTLRSTVFKDTSLQFYMAEGRDTSLFLDYTTNPTMLGRLYIDSEPRGAAIYLDDTSTGFTTPKFLEGIFPGVHLVTYKLPGFWDLKISVTVLSDRSITVDHKLVDSSLWVNYNRTTVGLPTNFFNDIDVQNGYIKWAASQEAGLFRYDDIEWVNYNTSNSSIPSDIVKCVTAVSNGVWIGTDNGLAFFDGAVFQVYNTGNSPLLTNVFECITQAPDGKIWIGTFNKGVYVFDGINWTHYNKNNSPLPIDFIKSIFIEPSGTVWIGTYGEGLLEKNGDNWTAYNSAIIAPSKNVEAVNVTDSEVWVGCASLGEVPGGVTVRRNGSWLNYTVGFDIMDITRDQSNFWAASYEVGLVKLSPDQKIYNTFNSKISSIRVNSIAIDGSGNKWISTFGGGITKYKGN